MKPLRSFLFIPGDSEKKLGKVDACGADAVILHQWEKDGIVPRDIFGGYGYMTEYPISQAYIDARISRIPPTPSTNRRRPCVSSGWAAGMPGARTSRVPMPSWNGLAASTAP